MTKAEVFSDLSLENIQRKIIIIMGSLSKVWKAIEDVKNNSSGEMKLSLERLPTI